MAALDFPDNPTNGQVYDKWTWNGTMWVLTAASGAVSPDSLPRGKMGFAVQTGNQALSNAFVDATSLSLTINFDPVRMYRVTCVLGIFATAASSIAQGRVMFGATPITEATVQLPIPNWADQLRLQTILQPGGANGTQTVKVQLLGAVGGGWSTHSAVTQGFLLIEDIGR